MKRQNELIPRGLVLILMFIVPFIIEILCIIINTYYDTNYLLIENKKKRKLVNVMMTDADTTDATHATEKTDTTITKHLDSIQLEHYLKVKQYAKLHCDKEKGIPLVCGILHEDGRRVYGFASDTPNGYGAHGESSAISEAQKMDKDFTKFILVCCVTATLKPKGPCGNCRDMLFNHFPHISIIVPDKDGNLVVNTIAELLPHPLCRGNALSTYTLGSNVEQSFMKQLIELSFERKQKVCGMLHKDGRKVYGTVSSNPIGYQSNGESEAVMKAKEMDSTLDNYVLVGYANKSMASGPCGNDREFWRYHLPNIRVIVPKNNNELVVCTIKQLLPNPYCNGDTLPECKW